MNKKFFTTNYKRRQMEKSGSVYLTWICKGGSVFMKSDKFIQASEIEDFPGGSAVKYPPASVGDEGSIPGLGRCPEERNGNPLQYSCLGNTRDRGAWRATVHGVAKESDMTQQLNNNSNRNRSYNVISHYSYRPICKCKFSHFPKGCITVFNKD